MTRLKNEALLGLCITFLIILSRETGFVDTGFGISAYSPDFAALPQFLLIYVQ